MTWNHGGRWLGFAAIALVTTSRTEPARAPTPASLVAAARALDDRAWRDYLHLREILLARGFAGRWIAIVDGQIVPRVGDEVAPQESIEALQLLVDPGHEGALHRYLFRIGEEGEAAYHYYAPNLPWSDALGVGLFRATFLHENGSDVVFGPGRVYATRGERKHSWAYGEKGIDLVLADPTGSSSLAAIVTPSSACDGTFVLSSETAAMLGLEKFEIPGTCWYGPEGSERFACRRARVRWRVPELGVDALIPVAIWPPRPVALPAPR